MNKNEEIHVVEPAGNSDRYLTKAKKIAVDCYNANHDDDLTPNDFYIVWFGKGLQNWKAVLVTTNLEDGLQYEITYNGDRRETYVNQYLKTGNFVIADIPAH